MGATTQHAGPFEPLAVGVQQVRRPVQRDRRLAGARAALDDEHPRASERMIRSCSPWIVATMSPMWPVRLAVKRPAAPLRPTAFPVRLVQVGGIQQVVVDADDLTSPQPQVPAPTSPRGAAGVA